MHAPLPPSGAHRWVPCPGSIKTEALYPEIEDDSTREGIAAHWLASEVLKSYLPGSPGILFPITFINNTAPNGIIINEEMADAVDVYVHDVLSVVQEHGLLSKLKIETKVTGDTIHTDNWGTPDCFVYDEKTGTLYIWDFKYGHRPIEIYGNWQLINYALIILSCINGMQDQFTTVDMRIIQPRCYKKSGPIDKYSTLASNLRQEANQLRTAAEEVLSPIPSIHTGIHCRDCRARHTCTGAQQAAQAGMEYSAAFPHNIHELTPENAAIELSMLERVEDAIKFRKSALVEQLTQQIKHGANVSGRSLQMGKGRQKWDKPIKEITTFGDLLHINLRKPEDVVTPSQAKKLGIDETVIKAYSVIPNTGLKLIKDDTLAKKVFSK